MVACNAVSSFGIAIANGEPEAMNERRADPDDEEA